MSYQRRQDAMQRRMPVRTGTKRNGSAVDAQPLAQGLGWFSLALGATELLAPRAVTRALGMEGSEHIVRAYGVREIATGIGILSTQDPAPWIWGRVGGDALDMATLATGLDAENPRRQAVGIALAAVAGVTALDLYCATALQRDTRRPSARMRVPVRDYGDRSGFPQGLAAARGAAADFQVPEDLKQPELLRPYTQGG